MPRRAPPGVIGQNTTIGTMEQVTKFLQSLQGFKACALVLGLLVGSDSGLPVNEDILLIGAAVLTLKGVMEPLPLIRRSVVRSDGGKRARAAPGRRVALAGSCCATAAWRVCWPACGSPAYLS